MNSELSVVIYILVLLSSHENEKLTSTQISERIRVNPARIRRVLSSIKKVGYVKAKEGIDGGYVLSKDPYEITLKDVYTLVSSKPLQIPKPSMMTKGNLTAEVDIQLANIFIESEQQLMQQLEKITLGSMLHVMKECALETVESFDDEEEIIGG
ncbi:MULTISPECIES: Rrf2 family transcriptional regulator [Paenibacillus]|uniref:BadM/Rrf2 family transcriptional regulator n=1 Tax=Paenibacillus pabuli TaxID=1472 RepID=A0A855XUM7_9BACL|nr:MULTISPECIES: Rrf2 family transcriptional regulator [Paenibacillus]PWW38640.1 BadM/Rrf2 family transcriptional regulator [Paenibacillus pabuli]PXW05825.1 BadM/Rrf2 family transcriptional regulator [Paenibacillus taichungensis]RAI87139.1 Rrf2 family protein [Paenibacillus pabuli]